MCGRSGQTKPKLVLQVIYDQLVKPQNSITNYHTDKSGITEELLRDIKTTLQDVQAKILELVPAEAILVGHALENDLKALKVVHMRCIDTGALFPHPKVSCLYQPPFVADVALRRYAAVTVHSVICH